MKYVADDGTEFDTEKECLEYENDILDIEKSFIIFNDKLDKVKSESADYCYYLNVLKRCVDVSEYLYSHYGLGMESDDINRCGIYLYDDNGRFRYVNDLIDDYSEKVEKLKNAVTKITKSSSDKKSKE